MTAEEYAQLAADAQAEIVSIISSVVRPASGPKAKVLDRDPVSLDDAQWVGSLKSDEDVDVAGDKRVHTWLVTFAGSDDLESSTTRSIEPTFFFRIQVFYSHDSGTDADNSEKRIREEVLKVQWALAEQTKLDIEYIERHRQMGMRVRLARMGETILHRGESELAAKVTALRAY